VVAEARLAWNDERGFASDVIPGFGLHEVFGGREKLIRPVQKLKIFVGATSGLPEVKPGETILGEAFEEDLEPLGAGQVLARFANHEAATVANSYGKGRAILLGSFPALACERDHDASTKRLLLALARAAGVSADVEVTGEDIAELEVRRLVGERAQFLFAFNHSAKPGDATIAVRLPWPVREVRNVVEDRVVPFHEAKAKTIVQRALAPGEIQVLRMDRR
jgi:beta-galactosidase